jgi:hypothetical protein
MAFINVVVWRPKAGRAAEFLAQVSEAKKMHERLGARVRVLQAGAGPNPFTVTYVTEHTDGKAYGEFLDKLLADAEYQSFWAKALTDPTAEPLQSSLLSELPL